VEQATWLTETCANNGCNYGEMNFALWSWRRNASKPSVSEMLRSNGVRPLSRAVISVRLSSAFVRS